MLGLNQTEFANYLHISRAYLSQIEGGREPSQALQDLFGHIERQHIAGKSSLNEPSANSAGKTPIQSVLSGPLPILGAPDRPITPIESVFCEPQAGYGGARSKLKAARLAAGLNVQQLAKAVGYSVATYQDIEDGRSQMGEKMAAKVARVLGIPVEDLTNGSDHPPERGGMAGTFGTTPEIVMGPGMENARAKFVPLLSMAQCGAMMAYDDTAYDHSGFVCFNPQDPRAFAVKLAGDSMQPKFDAGDVAVIYPSKPARNGGVVIAKLREEHGGDVMFKLYSSAGGAVTLTSYNPAYPPMTWPREAFAWVYPVAQVTKEL